MIWMIWMMNVYVCDEKEYIYPMVFIFVFSVTILGILYINYTTVWFLM